MQPAIKEAGMKKNNFLWTTTGIAIGILAMMAILPSPKICFVDVITALICMAWITMFAIANTTGRRYRS